MYLTQEYLNEIFEYSEESPSGLIRRVPVYYNRFKCGKIKYTVGSVVGALKPKKKNCKGYWYTSVDGIIKPVHRLIWTMLKGEIPPDTIIDHIDGNPHNNRIENLRLSSFFENARNTKKDARNTSGETGVYLNKATSRRKSSYWVAFWRENGNIKTKAFSIDIFGNEEAFTMAAIYRKQQIARLNSYGYGYTERHGM